MVYDHVWYDETTAHLLGTYDYGTNLFGISTLSRMPNTLVRRPAWPNVYHIIYRISKILLLVYSVLFYLMSTLQFLNLHISCNYNRWKLTHEETSIPSDR